MKRPEEILGDQILRLVDYALSKVIKPDITLDKVTDLNADELEKINFVKACQRLGVKPENILMVGNSLFDDIYGGQRNMMKTALVNSVEDREP